MKKAGKVNFPNMRPSVLAIAVASACAVMGQQAQADIITFTGNAPVYVASWYNGSFTEKHEFQYYLDWQGYCNAHFNSVCGNTTFWGVPFDWDLNRLPGLADDVRTPTGSIVAISDYNSVYKGYIPGGAAAGTLTANGQIRIGSNGFLRADSAYIADLYMGGGTLETQGLVTVANLSQTLGNFQGSGTTQVLGATTTFFTPYIKSGHTFKFLGTYGDAYGGSFSSTGPRLEPEARFINAGTLDGAKFMLQGSATLATLPRLINTGTLTGGLYADGVAVNNEGAAVLGDGGSMSFGPAGIHSGSFTAALNSQMTFGGPWGHTLLPTSSLNSAGTVSFLKGVHKVQGSYHAHETQLLGGGGSAYLDFSGSSVHMDKLKVDSGFGELRFLTASGVNLDELTITTGNVIFNTGTSGSQPLSTIQTLNLNGGSLDAQSPVNLVAPFVWTAGNISGSGGITALGGIEINAGTIPHGLYGVLRNPTTTNWNGGSITGWGTFENLAGATFNLNGDFSAGSGGNGNFRNAGQFIKTAGNGIASIGMAFHNNGLVRVDAGTLKLNGGGTHDGGHFEAKPGTLIELSGVTTLKGAVTTAGRVDITGGSLTLLGGASFTNALGNSVNLAALSNEAGATFVSNGSLNVSGTLENQGTFTIHTPSSSVGALVNGGNFTSLGDLSIGGNLDNSGTLNNVGALVISGGLNTSGNFRNDGIASRTTVYGVSSSIAGSFINEGSVEFLGGPGGPGVLGGDVQFSGTGSNMGSMLNGGGNFTLVSGGSLTNNGSFVNDFGTVYVQAGAYLGGTGSYVQTDGLTVVKGTLQADAGIDIQGGILRGGVPPGSTTPGAGTIIGNVHLHGQSWRWQPGNTPGTITVLGDVQIDGDASLSPGDGNIEIEFDSPTVHDRIVVSGTITFNDASIDLVFAPGFTALDGDSFNWLSAGQVDGASTIYYNVSGLSTDWQATPTFGAQGVSLEMINLTATAIPTSGSHIVAAGGQSFNDTWTMLDSLTIAGSLSNRRGGVLTTRALNVDVGGRLLNRADFNAWGGGANAGTMINRAGGSMSVDAFSNSGTITNEGVFNSSQGLTNLAGARFENRGVMNADYSEIVNRGEFLVAGTLNSSAPAWGQVNNAVIKNYGAFTVAGTLNNNTESSGPAGYTGSISNRTAYDGDGNVVSSGKFNVERGGKVQGIGTYFQMDEGTETRVDGVLAASDITLLGGTLTGSGTLVGPVNLGNSQGFGAVVQPGNSPDTLTIDGTLNAYNTIFDIELAGPGSYDQLVVNGDAHFTNSTVNFLLHIPDGISYDYLPAAGDSFTWLTVGGTVDGLDGLNWNLVLVGDGYTTTVASNGGVSNWWATGTGLNANFNGNSLEFTAAVPEPETWAMLLAGMGLIAVRLGRRARTENRVAA